MIPNLDRSINKKRTPQTGIRRVQDFWFFSINYGSDLRRGANESAIVSTAVAARMAATIDRFSERTPAEELLEERGALLPGFEHCTLVLLR
jgi:hypothetical protein